MATLPIRSKDNPWKLKTPPGSSAYTMHTDEKDGKAILVCTVGSTVLHYDARCIDDLHAMLKQAGDWVELGGADEQKPAKEGSVEACGEPIEATVTIRVSASMTARWESSRRDHSQTTRRGRHHRSTVRCPDRCGAP